MNRFQVELAARMQKWMDEKNNGKLYAPLPIHPLTDGLPLRFGYDRWNRIEPFVGSVANYTALDIGAHWGSFSFMLAKRGYEVTAVERDPLHAGIMRDLVAVLKIPISIYERDFTQAQLMNHYDLILAMGVMHFYADSEERMNLFVNSFPKCDLAFVQGFRQDAQSKAIPCDQMLVALAIKLNASYQYLGDADDRPIYKFEVP